MIDPALMQAYIRDANPIPDVEHLNPDELAPFIAALKAKRPALPQGWTQRLTPPETTAALPETAWRPMPAATPTGDETLTRIGGNDMTNVTTHEPGTATQGPVENTNPSRLRRNRLVFGLAMALLVVAVGAIGWWVGSTDRDTTETAALAEIEQLPAIHGMWTTELEGVYLTFNEDGSWTSQPLLDLEVFRDVGTFTFDGEVLTVRTDPGFECASYADIGSYEVDFTDENTIRLTVIDDKCTGRANDFTSGLVRYSP